METKPEKEVRFLKAYAVVATLLCAGFVLTAFTKTTSTCRERLKLLHLGLKGCRILRQLIRHLMPSLGFYMDPYKHCSLPRS